MAMTVLLRGVVDTDATSVECCRDIVEMKVAAGLPQTRVGLTAMDTMPSKGNGGAVGKWRIIVITSSVHSVTGVPQAATLSLCDTLLPDPKVELKTKATVQLAKKVVEDYEACCCYHTRH